MHFIVTAIPSVDAPHRQVLLGHMGQVAAMLDGAGPESGFLTTVLYCLHLPGVWHRATH